MVEASFFTSGGFFALCMGLGLIGATLQIIKEERERSYPKGHKRNVNRIYHFPYMALMIAALISGLRALAFNPEVGIVWIAFAFGASYLLSIIVRVLELNFPWKWVQNRYGPERTTIP
jgi:hypothetical protein